MSNTSSTQEQSRVEKCRHLLDEMWQDTIEGSDDDIVFVLNVISDIKGSLTGNIKTYRYVLLTQLLAKAVDPDLDCRSLQANNFPYPGGFDARTIAHQVVVPFDKENHNVLGGSDEPYVSKPLRWPGILPEHRNSQKDKNGWDALIRILDAVQNDVAPQHLALKLLKQTLKEIYRLVSINKFEYPVPNRLSLYRTIELVQRYTSERSGGDRIEVVATALFRTLGKHLGIYDEIRREKVNAADSSSGMSGDIECYLDGRIVLVVEVRDKIVTLTQIESSVLKARSMGITEMLFVAEKGLAVDEEDQIHQKQEQEFSSGQNVYCNSLSDLISAFTVLIGERGRAEFIRQIGIELDRLQSNVIHRKAWANLLRGL